MREPLDTLRSEFEAREGSFLLALRCDLTWDKAAFERVTTAMLAHVRQRDPEEPIPRWIAEGFWYMDWFVRDWSTHPSFPREHSGEYYEAAWLLLHDLANWLFIGDSPYEPGAEFGSLPPA
ncbi:MAG TPA: hypothetical protein VFJ82_00485 [Longimicrobium sp.]|nr:hypothetical protein [Longimicrobium sp.]